MLFCLEHTTKAHLSSLDCLLCLCRQKPVIRLKRTGLASHLKAAVRTKNKKKRNNNVDQGVLSLESEWGVWIFLKSVLRCHSHSFE